jgi:hypothetical protein
MSWPAMLFAIWLTLQGAADSEPPERHADLIHSDLPLWTSGSEEMWPRAFVDGDSFGCETRVSYGDWRFDETGEDDPTWYRFSNYGVFHCWMWVQRADGRDELRGRQPDASFFIDLGTAQGPAGSVELWALQMGSRPGSDYLLLSRQPEGGSISRFAVLQRDCPADNRRGGPSLSILLTRYCAINSRRELTQLARRMARRPPLGDLVFVGQPPGDD